MCPGGEHHLQPMTDEVMRGLSANIQDGVQLYTAADGFWGSQFEWTFFDVKVLIPRIRRRYHASKRKKKSGNVTQYP